MKDSVSVVRRVKLFLSVNWKDSLLTMLWNMILNQSEQKLRTDIKFLVRPDLPAQVILQRPDMM